MVTALAIEYGERTLALDVPDSRLAGVVQPPCVTRLGDVTAAVRESLDDPIGSVPLRDVLRRGRNALILTVDSSRPSPAPLLTPILDECRERGIEVTVCIAIGRHREMSEDEIRAHLTEAVCRRCRVIQHDPFDDSAHEDFGVTQRGTPVRFNRAVLEHDLVLGVGIIEPSYLAGFSGGRKLLLPGVAHHTTIDANHYLLLDPGTKIGRLKGNPLSEDATEASRKAPFHWITYAVVGPRDETVEVVSGDPYTAHEAACERSARIYRVARQSADIVVSSPGGFPYDMDLVQTKKAVVPATECVKPGGTIVLVGESIEGWGAERTFANWLRDYSPQEIVERVKDRSQFSLGAHGANILAKPVVDSNAEVMLVTNPQLCEELAGTFVRAVADIQEALDMASERLGPNASVLVLKNARRLIVQ